MLSLLRDNPCSTKSNTFHRGVLCAQVGKKNESRNFKIGLCAGPQKVGTSKGECYRQNHRDRTNLRMLNFADNKDLNGVLSESLAQAPGIAGTQFVNKDKTAPRHRNGLTLLIGDRSARPSLLLISGTTKRHISIAAHQSYGG
jgi:hypothetical protein